MAKRKKLQDQNPPRRVNIQGDDHLLAYITPEEAALLKSLGGAGEPGPMGIPHYRFSSSGRGGGRAGAGMDSARGGGGREDSDDRFSSYSGEDVEASYGTSDAGPSGYESGGGGRTMSDAQIQSAIDAANATLGPNVSEYGIASDIFGSNLFGGGFYPSGTEFGTPNYKAVTDVYNQIEKAKMYEQPIGATIMSLFNPFAALPKVQSLSSQFMGPRFINALAVSGNTPIYSGGRVVGVRNKYGDVVEGRDPNADEGGAGRDGGAGNIADTRPVNPVTGQCDAGYIFDEQLNACRLDTRAGLEESVESDVAPGTYARLGLLDVAPTGLSDFATRYGMDPQDFAASNLAYRRGAGTQFGIFQDPYEQEGYTLLG